MDDFPAGPTSPGPRRPPLSVVIPVRNGGLDFERCLRGLRDSTWTDFELVVVDDGSTDDSAALAESFGARVVRHERSLGPAAARNTGAEAASGAVVFFLDADVVLHPESLARAMHRLSAQAELTALFGSYDDAPSAPGLVSRFRNLLHHYIHQRGEFHDGARPVHTFWTGCGAIRRQAFLELGGFDPQLYRRPAIEDIELGYRLTRAGYRIELVRDVLATHLKRWTLWDVCRTDIFRRGVPWMLLLWRAKVRETDLNVSPSQRLCVAATGLGLLALPAALWTPAALAVSPLVLLAIIALNLDFYRFLAARRGARFAAASVWPHAVYYCCCGASVILATIWYHLSRRRRLPAEEPWPAHGRADAAGAAVRPRSRSARSRRPRSWTRA